MHQSSALRCGEPCRRRGPRRRLHLDRRRRRRRSPAAAAAAAAARRQGRRLLPAGDAARRHGDPAQARRRRARIRRLRHRHQPRLPHRRRAAAHEDRRRRPRRAGPRRQGRQRRRCRSAIAIVQGTDVHLFRSKGSQSVALTPGGAAGEFIYVDDDVSRAGADRQEPRRLCRLRRGSGTLTPAACGSSSAAPARQGRDDGGIVPQAADHGLGAGLLQRLGMAGIGVAGAREADDAAAGGDGRRRRRGRNPRSPRRWRGSTPNCPAGMEEDVRRRLAPCRVPTSRAAKT